MHRGMDKREPVGHRGVSKEDGEGGKVGSWEVL